MITVSAQEKTTGKNRHWIVPDHMSLQYAGGIGFVSAGVGYANKKDKLVADIMYGHVPKWAGGVEIHTATAKFGWWPIKAYGKNNIQFKPLGIGLLVNYSFGSQYYSLKTKYYTLDYYDHPTSLHGAVFISSALQTKYLPEKKLKQWQMYAELLTYDVDVVSYVNNKKSISLTDILSMGIGIRTKF